MAEAAVPLRVHVVPLGFEYERLRVPIREWRADKVVAVEYDEGEPIPYVERLLEELSADDGVELTRRACDIFDLYEALGTIVAAVDDHPDDEVYVHLSAGSKITAIAGMIACMAGDAHPIYARPDYGPDSERVPDEPLHDEVASVFELPTYPIERPSETLVAVMDYIERAVDGEEPADAGAPWGRYRGVSKKELVAFVREAGFPFVTESEATTEKGYYRLLETHVVRPLTERGYTTVEQVGRRKYVSLTSDGEDTLRAFRHVLAD